MAGNTYQYSPLKNGDDIRLLRISPSTDRSDPVRGHLFEYPLSKSEKHNHLYEALSYTWGAPQKTQSIWIGEDELPITANLHAALLQLRNEFIDRIIWIDAICINQNNNEERARQVQHMVEIYCKASQVIVWLGEATPETDDAFETIRAAAESSERSSLQDGPVPASVTALLQNPWFRRIWVLQEVAAARHVIIACGASQIDGYALCLGLPPSSGSVGAIESLIRGSIFRPRYFRDASGKIALRIRPLGELMDMYHSHEATEPLDKIFALLGMSNDGTAEASLAPNYTVPWDILFARLINFLLGDKIAVQTFVDKQTAVIYGQGYVLGTVVSVATGNTRNRDPQVTITFAQALDNLESAAVWTLQPAIGGVQSGDILCWLQGAPKPMLIRPRVSHFSIIMVSVAPPESNGTHNQGFNQESFCSTSTLRNFTLSWDYECTQSTGNKDIKTWLDDKLLKFAEPDPQEPVRRSHLLRRVAQILRDAGQHSAAAGVFQEAFDSYQTYLGNESIVTIDCGADLAVVHGHLKEWTAAKELWELIILTGYVIGLEFPTMIDYLENFVSTLKSGEYKQENRIWQMVRDLLQAKQEKSSVTTEMVLETAEFLDSYVVNVLFDQWNNNGDYIDEGTLIAAAKNELYGASVMTVILERSRSETHITDSVLLAAARNHSCGSEITKILLERRCGEAPITREVLFAAASNGVCNRALMQILLSNQWNEAQMNCISKTTWEELASHLPEGFTTMEESRMMSLVQAFETIDDNTIIRLILAASNPRHPTVRRLLRVVCEEFRCHHLDVYTQTINPRLEEVVSILGDILLRHGTTETSKLLEVFIRQGPDADDKDVLNEEIVNGCSRIMEDRTPVELSFFLDSLHQLGISFGTRIWPDLPPTQSAIVPATASNDHSFLKILVERKVVSVRTGYFVLNVHSVDTSNDLNPTLIGDWDEIQPIRGGRDWPLHCAIRFAYDPQLLRYLCHAGARIDPCYSAQLREQPSVEVAREDFYELRLLFFKLAGASTPYGWVDGGSSTLDQVTLSWPLSFPQAWRSTVRIALRHLCGIHDDSEVQKVEAKFAQNQSEMTYVRWCRGKKPSPWPEGLSSQEAWERWRLEAISILEEATGQTGNWEKVSVSRRIVTSLARRRA